MDLEQNKNVMSTAARSMLERPDNCDPDSGLGGRQLHGACNQKGRKEQ